MMIMKPEWITQEMFYNALRPAEEKDLPALPRLRLETYPGGS